MDESKLFLISLLIILVLLYVTMNIKIPEAPSFHKVLFSSTIKGCAQREYGMAPRGPLIEETKPTITTEENEIEYSRILRHLCCRMVRVYSVFEGWTINIYESWSGLGCECTCFSEISARIENLPKGIYTVNVYEKGINTDGSLMEEKLIISEYVTI